MFGMCHVPKTDNRTDKLRGQEIHSRGNINKRSTFSLFRIYNKKSIVALSFSSEGFVLGFSGLSVVLY